MQADSSVKWSSLGYGVVLRCDGHGLLSIPQTTSFSKAKFEALYLYCFILCKATYLPHVH